MGWGWGYSKVKDCTRQHWPNLPTVHTVTRLVKMEVKQPIPRNLNIGGIGVKIWHMGQPARCDVCANGHVTAEWLLKGLCRTGLVNRKDILLAITPLGPGVGCRLYNQLRRGARILLRPKLNILLLVLPGPQVRRLC